MSGGHDGATTATATLGTARRAAAWPAGAPAAPRPGADDAVRLLDALALGAALGRAGRVPEPPDAGAHPPAAPDPRPEAPARAAAVLDLHLTRPAAGRELTRDLVEHWLRVCADRGLRVPHRLLPAVLDQATATPELRAGARAAGGTRAGWLAAHHPAWAWFGADDPAPADWPHLSRTDRGRLLQRLRVDDPAEGARLVAATWSTDAAADRRDHVAALETGLGLADEPLLESALDDRAAPVRATAARLLDALPGSRRAARMAERLRPLLGRSGLLRARLTVELPDDADEAAARDGLGDPPGRRSRRGWHLERLAAGAPLETWTAGGVPLAAVVRDLPDDARAGVVTAVMARRDAAWAAALLDHDGPHRLLGVLPQQHGERFVLVRMQRADADPGRLAAALPVPWSRGFSDEIARRLRREPLLVTRLGDALAGMDAGVLLSLADWASDAADSREVRVVRHLLQFRSGLRSIDEAFA